MGVELATKIYHLTDDGVISKDFGIRDQMRRAAVSIASNIAEGDELDTQKQAIRFFYIAKGSCAELYTQVFIAKQIGSITNEEAITVMHECKKISSMLQKLISVRSKSIKT